jgi:hypothetical protein
MLGRAEKRGEVKDRVRRVDEEDERMSARAEGRGMRW